MRRLSCIPEVVGHHRLDFHPDIMVESERRASQQEIDSALHFLERRQSSGSNGVIGNIQPDLYRKRGSLVKISSSKDNICVGSVQLQLSYTFSRSDFVIVLLETSILINLEECQLIFSLGSNNRRESAKIIPGSSIPVQTFKVPLSYQELMDKTLTVQLFDTSSKCLRLVGKASTLLSKLNPSDEMLVLIELDPVEAPINVGELQLWLQYLTSAQRFTVNIQQSNQNIKSAPGTSVYFKATLIMNDKVLKKKKTGVKKIADKNNIWNEALMFSIDHNSILKCDLEIALIEIDRNQKEKTLGKILFVKNNSPEGRLWKEVLEGRSPPPQWFNLRDF
ncbi:unnamed protein product [Bursaphelenchus xylophilus]|uniref:(pine wood nematode) hypothetical protein n=1 Tax=Bursaphelenchus xylophilus TaxID=6326 RepID=A0A1I7RQ08_BURXY|nr:unnamed protein product [Bursaphelenchus xylophilus]CAG9096944.1 unnamed protein product [Bursaphelenchus xylophilus]